jgi:hypothetical protein
MGRSRYLSWLENLVIGAEVTINSGQSVGRRRRVRECSALKVGHGITVGTPDGCGGLLEDCRE